MQRLFEQFHGLAKLLEVHGDLAAMVADVRIPTPRFCRFFRRVGRRWWRVFLLVPREVFVGIVVL